MALLRQATTFCLVALTLALVVPIAASARECSSYTSCAKRALVSVDTHAPPPAGFRLAAREVIRISDRTQAVRAELRLGHGLRAAVYTRGPGEWQVSYFRRGREVARTHIADATGRVLDARRGSLPAGRMQFYGYDVPWRHRLFLLMAALTFAFLLGVLRFRRPFTLHHVDLLALVGFMVPLAAMTIGHPAVAVALVYPFLAYLFVRLMWLGIGRARIRPEWVNPRSDRWLLIGLLVAFALRVLFNVTSSFVTDEGYGGVVGANSIHHGWPLYNEDSNHLDVYGPIVYLAYLPFELVFPMDANWTRDSLPAAHAAAIGFDLLTLVALYIVGRRLATSHRVGLTLAFAWATYPFTLFVLAENDNDALVGLLVILALLALAAPVVRGALIGLAAGTKFAPLALTPLFATGAGPPRRRKGLGAIAAATGVAVLAVFAYLPDGGVREFVDTTIVAAQRSNSPFSIWSLFEPVAVLRVPSLLGLVLLAALLIVWPTRRAPIQVAALAAAVLIGIQITSRHWLYPYTLWFAPLALVAFLVPTRAPSMPGRIENRVHNERAGTLSSQR